MYFLKTIDFPTYNNIHRDTKRKKKKELLHTGGILSKGQFSRVEETRIAAINYSPLPVVREHFLEEAPLEPALAG